MYTIDRELRVLRMYCLSTVPVFAVLAFTAFAQKARFGEIDVERINIIEGEGKTRMVISNRTRAPDAVLGGKTIKRQSGNSAGIIFYNDEGEEDGGLQFGGATHDRRYEAGGALLFDQYHQDQVVGLQYSDANGRRYAGLQVWDRPDIPLVEVLKRDQAIARMPEGLEKAAAREQLRASGAWNAPIRVFVGRDQGKASVVDLKDPQGNSRARLRVDSLGSARLEFLDAAGHVQYAVPDSTHVR